MGGVALAGWRHRSRGCCSHACKDIEQRYIPPDSIPAWARSPLTGSTLDGIVIYVGCDTSDPVARKTEQDGGPRGARDREDPARGIG